MPETMKQKGVTTFARWIEASRELVARSHDPLERVTGGVRLMEELLQARDGLDLTRFTPGKASYARHLIHRDPEDRFCLLCLVWKPGQGTPIHDHAGTWGVYGILKNRMRFTNYTPETVGSKDRLAVVSTTVAVAGSVTTVLPPHCDIHRMENPDRNEVSLTLHCYGRELLSFNIFQPESGAKRVGTVSYDTMPVC